MEGAFAFCMTHGVLADEECHALNASYEPIPGLYVCGNTMSCRFAEDYPTTIMGVSHSMAMTFGLSDVASTSSLPAHTPPDMVER